MFEVDTVITDLHSKLAADADIITNFGAANVHKWYDLNDYQRIAVKPFVNIVPIPSTLEMKYPKGNTASGSKIDEIVKLLVEVVTIYDPNPANSLSVITLAKHVYDVIITNSGGANKRVGGGVLQYPITALFTSLHLEGLKIITFEISYQVRT